MLRGTRTKLAVVMAACALLAGLASPVLADSKDDLERQKRGVSGQIEDAQKHFDESSKKYAAAVARLRAAQSSLDAASAKLRATRGELATATARDAKMQAQLEKAQARLETAEAKLVKGKAEFKSSTLTVQQFTVDSVQQGDQGLRAFGDLLRGEDPATFSERIALNSSIAEDHLATMQELEASKVILKVSRDRVESLRDEVKVKREEAAANLVRKRELEAAAQAQRAAVNDLVGARASARNKAAKIKAADAARLRQLEADRRRLEAQLAELARKALSNGGAGSGGDSGGTLSYPVSGPITSQYGMRVHPITGVYKLHDGTDFGVGCGTPIRAAASGTIISQYYNGGYGNRVILNNGIKRGVNVVTTYNHLSSFAVSTGSKVSRGQTIGYVGSTGYSTGCHLHFMVLANGATTNPVGWF